MLSFLVARVGVVLFTIKIRAWMEGSKRNSAVIFDGIESSKQSETFKALRIVYGLCYSLTFTLARDAALLASTSCSRVATFVPVLG